MLSPWRWGDWLAINGTQPPEQLRRATMRRFVLFASLFIVALSVGGLALPLIAPLFEGWTWRPMWLLDLGAHWQWLYLGMMLLGIGMGATSNKRVLLLLPLVALPFLTSAPGLPTGSQGKQLTIVSANVEYIATNPDGLMRWARTQNPDIIIILEVSPEFSAKLPSRGEFPYQLIRLHPDAFGLAILSKYPISDWAVRTPRGGTQRIDTIIEFDGRKIAVSAYHPRPPFNPGLHRVRNTELKRLATVVAQSEIPGLIAGDFNSTPWSTAFSGLDAKGWRRASGLRPTWPTSGYGVVGIPIDHVLATKDWQLMRFAVGPNIGSDHYPIVAQLALTPSLHSQSSSH